MLALRLRIVPPALGAARFPRFHGFHLGNRAVDFLLARLAMLEAGVEPPPLDRPWLASPIWTPGAGDFSPPPA